MKRIREIGSYQGQYQATIMGSHFEGATEVRFCNRRIPYTVHDDQSIRITIVKLYKKGTPFLVGQTCPPVPTPSVFCSIKVTTPWGFDTIPETFEYPT
ncbi:MAG: hypothetical protein SGJ02_11435 [bacterium]|nr:hypothetical protein [bacterium]